MSENEKVLSTDILREVATSNLNNDTQNEVIKKLLSEASKGDDDSLMDKIFGKRNPQMYVTLLMSFLILIIFLILTFVFRNDLEFVKFLWNIAIPAVTLLWGYAFGKSQSR